MHREKFVPWSKINRILTIWGNCHHNNGHNIEIDPPKDPLDSLLEHKAKRILLLLLYPYPLVLPRNLVLNNTNIRIRSRGRRMLAFVLRTHCSDRCLRILCTFSCVRCTRARVRAPAVEGTPASTVEGTPASTVEEFKLKGGLAHRMSST